MKLTISLNHMIIFPFLQSLLFVFTHLLLSFTSTHTLLIILDSLLSSVTTPLTANELSVEDAFD